MERKYTVTPSNSTTITTSATTLTLVNDIGSSLHIQKDGDRLFIQLAERGVHLTAAEVQHIRELLA